MKCRTSTDIAACLAILAALAVMLVFAWPAPPPLDRKLHGAIGEALARESLRLLGPGGQIVLITRDTETFPQPAIDALLRSFKRQVRAAHVSIAGILLLQIDPLRAADVPSGDFFESIRRAPAGHVIVSLLGPPLLGPEQRRKLGAIKPKIVAFCSGNQGEAVDLGQLFAAGLLHAAVVARPFAGPALKAEQPPKIFGELYQIVSASDARSIPLSQ